MVDVIAFNYGWNYADIMNIEYSFLIGLVREIRKREHLKLAQDAALHGVKIKNKNFTENKKLETIDEDKAKILDVALRKKLDELKHGK